MASILFTIILVIHVAGYVRMNANAHRGGKGDHPDCRANVETDQELRQLREELARLTQVQTQMQKKLVDKDKIIKKLQYRCDKENCDFVHNGKCFFGIFPSHSGSMVKYDDAVRLCAQYGTLPANVYGADQYNLMEAYARTQAMLGREAISAWLGMKANPSTKTYTLTNGDSASYLKWFLGSPLSYPFSTGFLLMAEGVKSDDVPGAVGLMDYAPETSANGVICEM